VVGVRRPLKRFHEARVFPGIKDILKIAHKKIFK